MAVWFCFALGISNFFSAIRPFKKYKTFNPSIMISQSKDGELVAKMALRNGWNPDRGSSSKGEGWGL